MKGVAMKKKVSMKGEAAMNGEAAWMGVDERDKDVLTFAFFWRYDSKTLILT